MLVLVLSTAAATVNNGVITDITNVTDAGLGFNKVIHLKLLFHCQHLILKKLLG